MSAPIWQPKGVGYDLVPQVPYVSYDEYLALLRQLKLAYYELVERCVEGALDKALMRPLTMSYYGISGIYDQLRGGGNDLFLKLTKGLGSTWCAAINAELLGHMDSATRTLFYYHVQPDTTIDLSECTDILKSVLKREVKIFLRHEEFRPFGYYDFTRKNFKFYCHEKEDIPVGCWNPNYRPIGVFQDIMAAFAMGTHPRLGGGDTCFVKLLPNELVAHIFSWDLPF